MNKKKNKGIKKTTVGALIFGLCASVVSFFLISFICAIIANLLDDPTKSLGALSLITVMLSGGLTGFSTAKFKGDGGTLPTFLASLIFSLSLLVCGLFMSQGKLPLVTVINHALFVLIAVIFSRLGRKREKKRKIRR